MLPVELLAALLDGCVEDRCDIDGPPPIMAIEDRVCSGRSDVVDAVTVSHFG